MGLKIVGGYDTNIQSFPYQALLIIEKGENYQQCGGSILNEKTVLTAAHCLMKYVIDNYFNIVIFFQDSSWCFICYSFSGYR